MKRLIQSGGSGGRIDEHTKKRVTTVFAHDNYALDCTMNNGFCLRESVSPSLGKAGSTGTNHLAVGENIG